MRALIFDSYYDAYRGETAKQEQQAKQTASDSQAKQTASDTASLPPSPSLPSGVVCFFRVVDGEMRKGDKIKFANTQVTCDVLEVGTLAPGAEKPCEVLRAGEVGYMHGAIKSVNDARVGDTMFNAKDCEGLPALGGYEEPVPVVYCGLFPVETTQYQLLRESLEKLQLNDAALCIEQETSSPMGFGFRCGFGSAPHGVIQESWSESITSI